MSFAAPGYLMVAAAAALVVAGLHLLAWRRPPPAPLPTARFVPERPLRALSRAVRPTDVALLALRMLLVLLAGAALARPSFERRAPDVARVVVVDGSRSADPARARARVRAELRPGDALVVFDSAAREIGRPSPDSIRSSDPAAVRGSLSPALVVAARAAERLRRGHDSVEIVLVSPVAAEEVDAATVAIRRAWRGPVRLARLDLMPEAVPEPAAPEVRAPRANDGVAAAMALVGPVPGGRRVRFVRDSMTASDSGWAARGGVLVVWPEGGRAPRWPAAARADTVLGVGVLEWPLGEGANAVVVVAPFHRVGRPPAGTVIARWSDGEPAATQAALGAGCIRSVAVGVDGTGDLVLGPSFRRLVRRLTEPCAGRARATPAADSVVLALVATSRTGAAGGPLPAGRLPGESRLAAALLGLAVAAWLAELWLRRGGARARA